MKNRKKDIVQYDSKKEYRNEKLKTNNKEINFRNPHIQYNCVDYDLDSEEELEELYADDIEEDDDKLMLEDEEDIETI